MTVVLTDFPDMIDSLRGLGFFDSTRLLTITWNKNIYLGYVRNWTKNKQKFED